MISLWLVLVATFLFAWTFLRKSRVQRMTAHIPGPKPLPLIGTLYCGFKKDDFVDTIQRLVKQYGSVVSLWFGPYYCAAISDPKDIELILKSNTELTKSFIYKTMLPWLGQGLITVNSAEKWRKHRKILTPTFHFKILEDFVPVFNQNSEVLCSILRSKVGKDVDMLAYVSRLAFDILCETAMGIKTKAQLNENSKYLETISKLTELTTERSARVLYYIDWIYKRSSMAKEITELTDYINGFVDNVIHDREKILESKTIDGEDKDDENIGKRKLRTFMDLLLEYKKSEGADFTDEDIRDEVNTFMFAGHDTTSTVMSFFTYLMAQNPEIQERLVEEQKAIFGDSFFNTNVTSSHLADMKYLEKAIKETMRLYPPAVFIMRTLINDFSLSNGYVIPAETSIMILNYCAHRNEQLYPEPEKFNPDRFDSPLVSNQIFGYVPFSAGPRNCIGQRYAMMEMKVVLSHLLRNFKILPSTIPIKVHLTVLLKSENGVHVKFEPRKL